MIKLTTLLCAGFVFWLSSAAAHADLVTPVSATATTSFAIPPSAMIDGSGLSGMGNEPPPVPTQTHDTVEDNMWIAALSSAAQDQSLEFTLDFNYDLSSAIIWNYNGVDGFGTDNSGRGIDEFDMLVSPDLTSPFVSVGTFSLAKADPLFTPELAAETFALTGATNVRRVKFDIISAHDGVDALVGLSEVRFDGTVLPPGPDRIFVTEGVADWFDGINWDPAVSPNATDETATFGSAITVPTTVVTNQSATVKAITFTNTNTYNIAGTGDVRLEADSGNSAITVSGGMDAGSHQFQAIVNLASDTDVAVGSGAELALNNALNLNGRTLNKTGDGTMLVNNQLNTGGGMITGGAGIIGGSGTVGGDLNIGAATVAPGTSTGILTVNGNYSQAAAGTLSIEIEGTLPGEEHDQLAVAQTASLAGTLELLPQPGYEDPVTRGQVDEFEVIVADTIDGTFDAINYDGTALSTGSNYIGDNQNGDEGLFRIVKYGDADVTVTNYLAQFGDANGDRLVDGQDFVIWNDNKFTSGNDWTTGDFNGDGIVDGQDFVAWNDNKFTSVDVMGVPEPQGLVVWSWLACLCLLARRR